MTGIMTILGLLSAPTTHRKDAKMGTTNGYCKAGLDGGPVVTCACRGSKNAVGVCIDWRQKAMVSKY